MTMEGLLRRGQTLVARNMQSAVVIEDMLGEGAQAEVYRGRIGDCWYAVKWCSARVPRHRSALVGSAQGRN